MERRQTIGEVHQTEAGFPFLLRSIGGAPDRLFYRGTFPAPSLPLLAIVGTRKATRDGVLLARHTSRALAERGFGIVSGLAFGIDAAAHEGALDAHGKTFAVLANGLDAVYPSHNEPLAVRIIEVEGCLLSEYPPGTPALPHQFLERNRIVSGLAIATIVIEAPIHSGALVTARLAAENGRDVFVFPGPAGHAHYAGSHHLIRTGARLVSSLADILEDLQTDLVAKQMPIPAIPTPLRALTHDEEKICGALRKSVSGCTVDELVALTGQEAWVINQKLTPLILEGFIEEKAGGIFSITTTL